MWFLRTTAKIRPRIREAYEISLWECMPEEMKIGIEAVITANDHTKREQRERDNTY